MTDTNENPTPPEPEPEPVSQSETDTAIATRNRIRNLYERHSELWRSKNQSRRVSDATNPEQEASTPGPSTT